MKSYSEMCQLATFEERLAYLQLHGEVGKDTFGFDRWLNQDFYRSREWRQFRDRIIVRDMGCDLGCKDHPICDVWVPGGQMIGNAGTLNASNDGCKPGGGAGEKDGATGGNGLAGCSVGHSIGGGKRMGAVPIRARISIHHINPITKEDVLRHSEKLLDPENVVCVSAATHKAIHYGTGQNAKVPDGERKPGDTCPWRK